VLGLVLAAAAAGCGDAADPPPVTATSGSAAVGSAGGEVTLRDGAAAGAAVTIPAGALASTVTITLRDNGVATGLPPGATAAGRAVLFGPEGQTFGAPVTLRVPATGAPTALYTRPASGGAWTPVAGAAWDAARGVMTGAVQHFSEFVPLRLETDAGAPSCPSGYGDCDANAANGCETNLANSAAHCGACANVCPAGRSCAAGACAAAPTDAGTPTDTGAAIDAGVAPDAGPLVCPSGFGDCDANPANGCETNLASSAANCGACGNACPAGRACVAGACAGPICASGYADCDGNPATGCETNVAISAANCGACGRSCTAGQSCAAGACVTPPADAGAPDAGGGACAPNRYDCDRNAANGCEVDLLTDAFHCGACGSACPAGRTCVLGVCR
jgi:hypothetical protein